MIRTLFRAAAALSMALSPGTLSAQAPVEAHPALWVVRDEDTTIYLFGTVHVLPPGIGWFGGPVRQAFDRSGEVVLELAPPSVAEAQRLSLEAARSDDGLPLTSKLPEARRGQFTSALAQLGLPAGALDRFDPWFAAVTLGAAPLAKAGWTREDGVEYVLTAAAEQAGKTLGGLETIEQQLGYVEGLPQSVQIEYLIETLDSLPDVPANMDAAKAAWAAGDVEGVAAFIDAVMSKVPAVEDVLVIRRNDRWADWIEQRLDQPGTIFIAVGAGHLAGRRSVQSMLEERQIEVERLQ